MAGRFRGAWRRVKVTNGPPKTPTALGPYPKETTPRGAGRGHRWARYRLAKLKHDPICEWVDNDGVRCRMVATIVAIVLLAEHGERWAWSNLQSLCRQKDVAKTAADAQRRKTGVGGMGDEITGCPARETAAVRICAIA